MRTTIRSLAFALAGTLGLAASAQQQYPVTVYGVVSGCTGNTSVNIATTIIDLAHNLGFKVVAEGVETKEQIDFLLYLGCDQFQGYYYSKPLPSDEFRKKLSTA